MLHRSLGGLVEILEAVEAGILLLHDLKDGRLAVRAAHGYDLERRRGVGFAVGEATCGKTFETGEPQFYPTHRSLVESHRSLAPDHAVAFREALMGDQQPQSAVCVPFSAGEKEQGVLMLENLHQPHSFVHADLPFLQAVMDLVALAVENAHLRVQLEEAKALDQANRHKGELLSVLAHEIRTPLTSIKGYTTAMLMEEASFDVESQRQFLEIIDEACDTLESLVHDLLESSVIDAGLLRLEHQPLVLCRLAEETIDEIAHRTDEHRFVIDFPGGFPIIDADPDRIRQVLRNLLDKG